MDKTPFLKPKHGSSKKFYMTIVCLIVGGAALVLGFISIYLRPLQAGEAVGMVNCFLSYLMVLSASYLGTEGVVDFSRAQKNFPEVRIEKMENNIGDTNCPK